MPESPTGLTEEETRPDQVEPLRPEDSSSGEPQQQARPSAEFDKEPKDAPPILNASFEVERVLDDGEVG
jgi:hypothetical protein